MQTISQDAIRATVRELLRRGPPSIELASHRLGVPVRTLQRRLGECGTSYSDIVDEVRFDLAARLLQGSDEHIAEIARATGFSDPSSFSRAFLRWAGMTPRAFRRQSRPTDMCAQSS